MSAIEPYGSTPKKTELKEYVLLLPRLLHLVWNLARDPRVPARSKALLFMAGGYIASPVDVFPDFIPGLGQLDDLVLIAFVLDRIINRVPQEVVAEHWTGDQDVLDVVRQILDISTAFVPSWLKNRL
jgi:uncharacterized membrane protein YkvA (DUF1232 family)